MNEADLVLLRSCADNHEAALIRSLLESDGIDCVVQGEQHRSMLGIMGAVIEVRVLVAERDREHANALLDAEGLAVSEPDESGPRPLDDHSGAVCAVHEHKATSTCRRCGAFLCDRCQVLDHQKPLCESCEELASPAPEARTSRRRRIGWVAVGILFGPAIVAAIALILARIGG